MRYGQGVRAVAVAALTASAAGCGPQAVTGVREASPVASVSAAAAPCTADDVKVSDARQSAQRPAGTGTGAVVVGVTNASGHACAVSGFPTVAGAGNGSPGRNAPLTVRHTGSASSVRLAPGGTAWVKLTFVQVQGEGDGYCVSGAPPVTYPTLVLGVPGAGAHQIAMADGEFAECDNTVTVTALSAREPA
ncbi:DUF4232 domain-containing protein [Streptomyces sp. NPDC001070]